MVKLKTMHTNPITVAVLVDAPIARVWDCWTQPEHIVHWAFASDDWEAPAAVNDVRVGGRFSTTMAAKDKSASFDFAGTYTLVEDRARIEYDMDDGRHATVVFSESPDGVTVSVTFDPESENTEELQRSGWQAISDNFKKYVENGS